jgi:hypothetical protein
VGDNDNSFFRLAGLFYYRFQKGRQTAWCMKMYLTKTGGPNKLWP